MRATRLFALFAVIICLTAAVAGARAADEAVPPPAAGAPAEVIPTPAPTPAPQNDATPPVVNKEAAKPKEAPKDAAPPASVTIISAREAHGVLGRDVRSAANEDMGKIVDVIVDRTGTVRAAVIDFGGFLGVGSRKIVVDWNALRFGRVADKSDRVSLELTKDQVKAAPEYKEDAPIVVLGASGSLQPLQFDDP
jgi:PRC-barrel domain